MVDGAVRVRVRAAAPVVAVALTGPLAAVWLTGGTGGDAWMTSAAIAVCLAGLGVAAAALLAGRHHRVRGDQGADGPVADARPDAAELLDPRQIGPLLDALGATKVAEYHAQAAGDATGLLAEIAAAGTDTAAVARHAHKLRGLAANVGFARLADLAGGIERAALSGKVDGDLLREVPDVIARTSEAARPNR